MGIGEIRIKQARLTTSRRDNIDFARPRVDDSVSDRLAVGRKSRHYSAFGHQPLSSTECRDHVDAASLAFGAKNNTGSVGRKVRLVIVGGTGSEAQRLAAGHLLHPDIEIPLTAA